MREVSVKRGFLFTSHLLLKNKKKNRVCYERVAKWFKNITGGDIFSMNKVFIHCHVGDSHWTCAVIFMNEKVVQYYDSLGWGAGKKYQTI